MLTSVPAQRLVPDARQDGTTNTSAAGRPTFSAQSNPKPAVTSHSLRPIGQLFEFAQVAFHLAIACPNAETIHLIVDNLNIHRRKSLTDLYGAQVGTEIWNRFTLHYTPTHGSWLNQAEIEIAMFARQCLGVRRIPDLNTLRRETRPWNRRNNRARTKINWKFDRKAAHRKFGYKGNSFRRSET
jgi:transposase